jgi:hypothetical protein
VVLVRNLEKFGEAGWRKAANLMGNSGGCPEEQNLLGMWAGETVFMSFQRKMRTVGYWNRAHSCYSVAKNLSTFCLCPETLEIFPPLNCSSRVVVAVTN